MRKQVIKLINGVVPFPEDTCRKLLSVVMKSKESVEKYFGVVNQDLVKYKYNKILFKYLICGGQNEDLQHLWLKCMQNGFKYMRAKYVTLYGISFKVSADGVINNIWLTQNEGSKIRLEISDIGKGISLMNPLSGDREMELVLDDTLSVLDVNSLGMHNLPMLYLDVKGISKDLILTRLYALGVSGLTHKIVDNPERYNHYRTETIIRYKSVELCLRNRVPFDSDWYLNRRLWVFEEIYKPFKTDAFGLYPFNMSKLEKLDFTGFNVLAFRDMCKSGRETERVLELVCYLAIGGRDSRVLKIWENILRELKRNFKLK